MSLVFSALFGGYWGSRLPDVFEPANKNPHHRALAHSFAVGTAISATAIEAATAWSMFFREKAERLAKQRQTMRSPEAKITNSIIEILLWIAAGVGPGLIVAYMSHLALKRSMKYCGKFFFHVADLSSEGF